MIALTLERMTDKDVDEFLALEKKVSVPKIYNPIVSVDEALEEIRDNELFFIKKGLVIVGTIAYQMKPDGSAYISNMSVVPEYQGQKIARTAMEMILNIIGSASRIWLVTHPENVKALNLYTSLGFVVENQVENYYGDGEPRLVLAKRVDSDRQKAKEALTFIIPILEKYGFRWVITGGFATLAYGVDRPLTDIDIDIDTNKDDPRFQEFVAELAPHTTQPLEHLVNEFYDNYNMEITVGGVIIDICPMADLKVFDKAKKEYVPFYSGFPEHEIVEFEGMQLPLLSKRLIIENKEIIMRDEWDARDITGLKALQL